MKVYNLINKNPVELNIQQDFLIGTTPSISTSTDFRSGSAVSVQYLYDSNGNLKQDLNKGIGNITYNSLNLPSSFTISNSSGTATNTYVYSADSRKLKVTKGTFTTDYCGNVIYENGSLKRILVDGGYCENGTYYFYLTDHLGNNRVVANQSGSVIQSTQYYPFGMAFADGTNPSAQPYKFGGKELDSDRGLNLYDFHARWQDAVLGGRFLSVDPLAEKYYLVSPYVYCMNNPVRFVDLKGDSISLAKIQELDQTLGTNYVNQITSDLQAQTGLTITVSMDGKMSYTKDADGNTIQTGSATARALMIDAIDHQDWVNVVPAGRSGVPPGTNQIRLSIRQINGFIDGTTNLDNRTLGWGMTIMHELHHTQVGGGLRDIPGNPGPVVTQMNIIRSELNALGGNYGQRLDYRATSVGSFNYMPFDRPSQSLLSTGFVPIPINKYIRFK